MAEKDITTWEEFKNALTEHITEKTTYNIKNDLDATDDILTENIFCAYDNFQKIFKGNDYKINGITSYGSVVVFSAYRGNPTEYNFRNYRFYNIKFTNFMIDSGTFTDLCHNSSGSDYNDLFVNCFFNGVCKTFVPAINTNRVAYFTKCSFNIRCENFSSDYSTFDSCYINITPLQNTNSFNDKATLINSYVEGVIKNSFWANTFLSPRFIGNNVFNCKVIITNYSDSTTYKVYTSDKPVLINKDRLLQSDGVTPIRNIASANNIYFLTNEQMKNKLYIQQNTTFPLYG